MRSNTRTKKRLPRESDARFRRHGRRKPALSLEWLEDRCLPSTFAVINTNDAGPGSLRQALTDANATAGADLIQFAIPDGGVHTIQPAAALPAITDPVTIDGYTQPGASANTNPTGQGLNTVLLIELDGTKVGGSAACFEVNSHDCTIRGFAVNRFYAGVRIGGSNSSNNHVEGNFLGTDVTGTAALGNTLGVNINSGGQGNVIGGTTAAARNLLSGNTYAGIHFGAPFTIGGSNDFIQGNLIGTDVTGTHALGNPYGVSLTNDGHFNMVGGSTAAARNVLSGNSYGVLCSGAGLNVIQGNFIGTDVTGTQPLGNSSAGVLSDNSGNTTIGGPAAELGNRIAYNGAGVMLSATNGSAVLSNSIFGNNWLGIDLNDDGGTPNDQGDGDVGANGTQNFPVITGFTADTITGTLGSAPNTTYTLQFFATPAADASGFSEGKTLLTTTQVTSDGAGNVSFTVNATVPPGQLITATATDPAGNTSEFSPMRATGNTIFVTNTNDAGPGSLRQAIIVAQADTVPDVVGFNIPGAGVHIITLASTLPTITKPFTIDGYTQPGSSRNTLAVGDNAVLNIELTSASPGSGEALLLSILDNPKPFVVRGLVINGFSTGIEDRGGSNAVIAGNFIGTDPSGMVAHGNGIGVDIQQSFSSVPTGIVIGGTTAADRNVISGNGAGIRLANFVTQTLIQGNHIGTNAAGTAALPNGVGIGFSAGPTSGPFGNTIGGTAPGAGNLISGNTGDGIGLAIGSNNIIQGNRIGTQADGVSPLGNGAAGVDVDPFGGSGNTVGGTASGAGNIIAFNGGPGVTIASGVGQAVLSNSIFANNGLGINRSNHPQDHPVLTGLISGIDGTTVTGSLTSTANATVLVQLFANDQADPSGFGEGQTLLGSVTVTTDTAGNASFTATLPQIPLPSVVTATATNLATNDTSEFSKALAFTSGPNADAIRVKLQDGIQLAFGGLSNWAEVFDLNRTDFAAHGLPQVDLPLLTQRLNALFDLQSALAGVQVPTLPAAASLDALRQGLEAAGFTLDFIVGGLPGVPAAAESDLIQVRYRVKLEDLVRSTGFQGSALRANLSGVLQDLAAGVSMGGDYTSLAADLTVEFVLGVDAGGFYLSHDSSAVIDVTGQGDVTAQATLPVDLSKPRAVQGSAQAAYRVRVLPGGPPVRLRTGAISGDGFSFLIPTAEGAGTLELHFPCDNIFMNWSAGVVLASDPVSRAVTGTRTTNLEGTLNINGLGADLPDGRHLTVPVPMAATHQDQSWSLVTNPNPDLAYIIDGVPIDRLSIAAIVSATAFAGAGTARINAPFGSETTRAVVPLQITFDTQTIIFQGTEVEDGLYLGDAPQVLWVHEATFSFLKAVSQAQGGGFGRLNVVIDRAVLLPAPPLPGQEPTGVGTIKGATGVLLSSPNLTLNGALSATLGGVINVTAAPAELRLGPDATGPLVQPTTATGTIPVLTDNHVDLDKLSITFQAFRLSRDGHYAADGATVHAGALEKSIGLAGLLPVDITDLGVDFPDKDNLDHFVVTVTGKFNFEALNLPFTPTLSIGNATAAGANAFTFSLDVKSLELGIIAPKDIGPITLGISNFHYLFLTLSGSITLGGYKDGIFQDSISGSFTVDDPGAVQGNDGADGFSLDKFTLTASGLYKPARSDKEVTTLTLTATADVHFRFKLGDLIDVRDGGFRFTMSLFMPDGGDLGVSGDVHLDLGRVTMVLGPYVKFDSTGDAVDIPFDFGTQPAPKPGSPPPEPPPFLQLKKVIISIPDLPSWGGEIDNLTINQHGFPVFADTAFVLDTPPDLVNFFDWLPIKISSVGLSFGSTFFKTDENGAPIGIGDYRDVHPIFSGSIGIVLPTSNKPAFRATATQGASTPPSPSPIWPISGSFGNVRLNFDKLRAGLWPIDSVDGLSLGVAPFKIAQNLEISGKIAFGQVTVDDKPVIYGELAGGFRVDKLGADIDLVVSQYGPVLAKITAPVGIPLGPTGLILATVGGALRFGATLPDITDPAQLTALPDPFASINKDTIKAAVAASVQAHDFTWNHALTVALRGTLIHAAAPNLVSADLTLGFNVGFGPGDGLKLFGLGTVNLIGLPLADAKVLLDFHDPLAPLFLASFQAPSPGNPVGFLFPAKANFTVSFDSKGLGLALVVGTRTFLDEVTQGTLDVAQDYFSAVLDEIAADLQADHALPLAQDVLDSNDDGQVDPAEDAVPVTRTTVSNRLQGLLPDDLVTFAHDTAAAVGRAARTTSHFIGALARAAAHLAGSVAADVRGALADVSVTVKDLVKPEADALLGFAHVVSHAVRDAVHQASDVIDPTLTIHGALQPVIFGIPVGPPEQQLDFHLSKHGLTFGAEFSPSKLFLKLVTLGAPGGGPVSGLVPLQLPVSDRVKASVTLPFDNGFDDIAGGTLPPIDPLRGKWAATLQGFLDVQGFQMADLGGFAFPDHWDQLNDHFQKLFASPSAPVDPNKVAITDPALFSNMQKYGGLLITGGLDLPAVLADPGALIANLPPVPTNTTQIPDWVTAVFNQLGASQEMGRVHFFLPSYGSVVKTNFDTATSETGGPNPRLAFNTANAATINAVDNAATFEGLWNGKILGISLGNAQVHATQTTVEANGTIPWLANLQAHFGLSTRPELIKFHGALKSVKFPMISAEATIGQPALKSTLQSWGLDAAKFVASAPTGGATFRAYSPGFDPRSNDPLKQRGGLALSAHLSIPGLLSGANFQFAVTPPSSTDGLPDFTASVDAQNLTIPGITVTQAKVQLIKSGGVFQVIVDGQATVLGITAHIHGALDSNLTGSLHLDVDTLPLFGFTVHNGTFEVVFSPGTKSLALSGTVAFLGQTLTVLPGSFLALTPQGPQGSVTLTLAGSNPLALTSDSSTGLADWHVNGTFGLTVTATMSSFSVDGTIDVPGLGSALHLTGSLDSAGLGALTLTAGHLDLGGGGSALGFSGTFTLSRQREGFTSKHVTTRFQIHNATFGWAPLGIAVSDFTVDTSGNFDLSIPGQSLKLGSSTAPLMTLAVPSLKVHSAPAQHEAVLQIGPGSLTIPGFARTFTTPGFSVGTGGDFSQLIASFDNVDLTLATVNGNVFFERQNGVFQLALRGTQTRTGFTPPTVSILGVMASISSFVIRADGTFNLDGLAFPRLGTDALNLSNLTLSLAKTGPGFDTSFYMEVSGGKLTIPFNAPITLPTFRFDSGGNAFRTSAQGFDIPGLSLPTFNLGASFQTLLAPLFDLKTKGNGFSLSLHNAVGLNVLGSTLTLNSFTADSQGAFSASVSGSLGVLGFTFAQATFDVSRNGNLVKLSIPESRALNVNLGFVTVQVSGSVQSDGHYEFDGHTSFNFAIVAGAADVQLKDTGFTCQFTGSVNFPVVGQITIGPVDVSRDGVITYRQQIPVVNSYFVAFVDLSNGNLTWALTSGGVTLSEATRSSQRPAGSPKPPSGATFPFGFFHFHFSHLDDASKEVTVTLHLPAPFTGKDYYKFGPTPKHSTAQWYVFNYDGRNGAAFSDDRQTVTLHFHDGELGDDAISQPGVIDDPGGPAKPPSTGDAAVDYVRDLYAAVLNRDPDPHGLATWVSALRAGMPRAQLVRGFWNSAEHRGRQVDTLYAAILDRSVDAAGRAHWVHALQTGLSEVDLSRTMLLSPEYRAARGDTRAFVEGLYLDILGRPADPRGLASWMAASHFPHSRGRILREFLEAPESHVHAVDDYFAWLLKTNVL